MGQRSKSLAAWGALVAVGLFAASPFFNRGLVGTGEAYNYSLSVADAVTQMRHGVIPPLAGQTEYAFNGRIHPLRNAPYLHYLCAGIDLATFHRLGFWEIQNVSLVLSIFGCLFACYGGLRWAADCPRLPAAFLACIYALAPPLMAAAHTFDLFMTVHAAVFVPLALAACVKGCRSPSFSNDAWLAAALAAAWLAHPPVAFWLTFSVILVRLVAFAGNPSFAALAGGLAAAALGLLLSGFVFVSAATLSPELGYFSDEQAVWGHFPDIILNSLRGAFPGMVLPVSAGAGKLSDLQMGYAALALIGLSIFLALRRSRGKGPPKSVRLAALGCALAAVVLVIMDLPVPVVTHWAWQHVLTGALKLTTEWPMQRLYLVGVALSVFAAGLTLPAQWPTLKAPRWVAPSAMLLAFAWTAYQARPFIVRGISNRWTLDATRSAFRPSNLDLTITSYAFIGPSPTYVHGVMDPRFEFRILRNGVDEITSPLASGLARAPVVLSGALKLKAGLAPGKLVVSPRLRLMPGHRYLLSFAFRIPPVEALLYLKGPMIDRTYVLPEAGEARGFGMMDGERHAIPIWTDSDKPEDVEIRVWLTERAVIAGKPSVFADYILQDVDMDTLPVRVESLLPLRFTVDAPQGGCTVETPRRFLPGFEATVNGRPAAVMISPYRQAMIPLPPGRSVVELSYPGPPLARQAFWLSVAAWLGFIAWRLAGSPVMRRPWSMFLAPTCWLRTYRWAAAGIVIIAAAGEYKFRERSRRDALVSAVGPVRVDFFLPYGRKNVNDPLLATGKVGAGVVVFVQYIDETHISLGADVWGGLFQSPPIAVDYSRMQTLVVSEGALFPKGNPRMKDLDPTETERLLNELRVELNGNVEIMETVNTYQSSPSEVLAGRTTFGSLTGPVFKGRIVNVERLPIPHLLMLPSSMHARLDVRFPSGRDGATEPLLQVTAGPESCFLSVGYVSIGSARLSLMGLDGTLRQTADVRYDPQLDHEIDVRPWSAKDGALTLACAFDGTPLFGTEGRAPSSGVPIMQSGLVTSGIPALQARFLGSEMRLSAVPNAASSPPYPTWGMATLVVTFPPNKVGRQEPLLTSGVTGAGDFVYVVYADEKHVKIGLDHWNGASVISDPIELDYRAPHEVWISSRPLYPDGPGTEALPGISQADRARLRSGIRVAVDGTTVISSTTSAYPCAPAQLTIGTNLIGGSSADPAFSGIIHFSGRMNPLAVSW